MEQRGPKFTNGEIYAHRPFVPFPRRLYQLLSTEKPSIVSWTQDGSAFQVNDPQAFCTHVLPKYFRHGKYPSFQRQLNLYGFHQKSGTYVHALFHRDHPENLDLIMRTPRKNGSNSPTPSQRSGNQHSPSASPPPPPQYGPNGGGNGMPNLPATSMPFANPFAFNPAAYGTGAPPNPFLNSLAMLPPYFSVMSQQPGGNDDRMPFSSLPSSLPAPSFTPNDPSSAAMAAMQSQQSRGGNNSQFMSSRTSNSAPTQQQQQQQAGPESMEPFTSLQHLQQQLQQTAPSIQPVSAVPAAVTTEDKDFPSISKMEHMASSPAASPPPSVAASSNSNPFMQSLPHRFRFSGPQADDSPAADFPSGAVLPKHPAEGNPPFLTKTGSFKKVKKARTNSRRPDDQPGVFERSYSGSNGGLPVDDIVSDAADDLEDFVFSFDDFGNQTGAAEDLPGALRAFRNLSSGPQSVSGLDMDYGDSAADGDQKKIHTRRLSERGINLLRQHDTSRSRSPNSTSRKRIPPQFLSRGVVAANSVGSAMRNDNSAFSEAAKRLLTQSRPVEVVAAALRVIDEHNRKAKKTNRALDDGGPPAPFPQPFRRRFSTTSIGSL